MPPLVGALLKNEQDVTLFEKLVFMNQRQPLNPRGPAPCIRCWSKAVRRGRFRRRRAAGFWLARLLGARRSPKAMARQRRWHRRCRPGRRPGPGLNRAPLAPRAGQAERKALGKPWPFVEPPSSLQRPRPVAWPLALEHEAGLRAAAADGELWRIRVTGARPTETRAYIETACRREPKASALPLPVLDDASGSCWQHQLSTSRRPCARRDRLTWYAGRAAHRTSTPGQVAADAGHAFDTLAAMRWLAHRQLQPRQPARHRTPGRQEGRRDPPPRAAPRRHHPRHLMSQHAQPANGPRRAPVARLCIASCGRRIRQALEADHADRFLLRPAPPSCRYRSANS